MRLARLVLSLLIVFSSSPCVNSQQSTTAPQRDPQAAAILRQSIAAMANSAPADSSATGTVTIVQGSTTQYGTIQILTRGTGQTSETITLPDIQKAVIYSNGEAREINATQSSIPPLEQILTEQCPDFPLPLLLSLLNNPDEAFRYLGQETLNGTAVQHIEAWNSFSSEPLRGRFAEFTLRDAWFDLSSGLPFKVAYSRRAGGGAIPSIPVEVFYSNYTSVGSVRYPFQINKSLNGTPWQAISIQSVSFNTGLTDAQFQVQ